MTTVDITVSDTLRGAAMYVKRYGLHRGGFVASAPTPERPFPAACAGAAIRIAVTGTAQNLYLENLDNGLTAPQCAAIYNALEVVALWVHPDPDPGLVLDDGELDYVVPVATWNDRPFMTADKVARVLEAIADQYEASYASTH